jgi:hypothetical protein
MSNSMSEKPFCLLRMSIQFSLDLRAPLHACLGCITEAIVIALSRDYRILLKQSTLRVSNHLDLLEMAFLEMFPVPNMTTIV